MLSKSASQPKVPPEATTPLATALMSTTARRPSTQFDTTRLAVHNKSPWANTSCRVVSCLARWNLGLTPVEPVLDHMDINYIPLCLQCWKKSANCWATGTRRRTRCTAFRTSCAILPTTTRSFASWALPTDLPPPHSCSATSTTYYSHVSA